MNRNNVKISCRKNERNNLSFYAEMLNEEVFLFDRKYTEEVMAEYGKGVTLMQVLKKTNDYRKQKIKDHIIRNLKYIESEYEISIFRKTMKKHGKKKDVTYIQQYIGYETA